MGASWADIVSEICGIIYSMAWNISFYPQLFENYRLKSVAGFSLEYALLNPSGYMFYSIYTTTGFIDPNLGSGHVDWQDLFFACHGLALSVAHLVQCFIYSRGTKSNQKFKIWCIVLLACEYTIFIVFLILQLTGYKLPEGASIINVCGYCKAVITFCKYFPQVILNYVNKSTIGWSIGNVILDMTGGMFSLLQLIIEAVGNGKPIIGDGAFNAVKFILSILSIFYNIIFLFQHYVLYRHNNEKIIEQSKIKGSSENTNLNFSSQGASLIDKSEHNDELKSSAKYKIDEGEDKQ